MHISPQQYVADQGSCCLFCGSSGIPRSDIDWDEPITVRVTCEDCGKSWREVLKVADVINEDGSPMHDYSVELPCRYNSSRLNERNAGKGNEDLLTACMLALDSMTLLADKAGDVSAWNEGGYAYEAICSLRAAIKKEKSGT